MTRFIVTRQYVKYKGKLYQKGELLPPNFTERDRCRNIYPSRIGTTEVDDIKKEVKEEVTKTPIVTPQAISASTKGTNNADNTVSTNKPLTGTHPVQAVQRKSISK